MKATILCVDDSEPTLLLLRQILEDEDYAVLAVKSGCEALQMLSGEKSVCLAVLDLYMPDMGGLELARVLEAEQPRLPVIMLTIDPQRGNEPGTPANIRTWLGKPFEPEELAEEVAKWVQRSA